MSWRELEIIAGQTSTASFGFACWYLRLNPPCWRDRKEAGRGGKASFFLDRICAYYWILMPGLNKHTYFDRGRYSDGDSEREHGEERKRLDEIRKRRVKEATAEVISFSTLNLPCRCNNCSGVSWEPNHTGLWELLSFSITPSQSKTFSLSVILKAAVSSQWKNKDYKLLLPRHVAVVVILVQFDLSPSIFQRLIASIVSLSLSLSTANACEDISGITLHSSPWIHTRHTSGTMLAALTALQTMLMLCPLCRAHYPSVIGSLQGLRGQNLI